MEKLPKNIGSAVGLELQDNTHALDASNSKLVKAGMAFNVSLGEFVLHANINEPGSAEVEC